MRILFGGLTRQFTIRGVWSRHQKSRKKFWPSKSFAANKGNFQTIYGPQAPAKKDESLFLKVLGWSCTALRYFIRSYQRYKCMKFVQNWRSPFRDRVDLMKNWEQKTRGWGLKSPNLHLSIKGNILRSGWECLGIMIWVQISSRS